MYHELCLFMYCNALVGIVRLPIGYRKLKLYFWEHFRDNTEQVVQYIPLAEK